eukprot:jgi/Tetstr1/449918/TSEL_036972.t1
MASMSRKLEAYRVRTEDGGEENEKQEAVALAGCDVHSSQLPSSADASPEMRRPNKVFDRDGDGNIHLSELARAARAYNELISKKDAYSLEAFPEHLHPTLATFDTNGDGSVSATELAHAAGLYRKGKQKRKQLTRTIIGLSVLTALLLLIIMALMFLVVWVMKDTSTSGAMLTTKDRSSALSTGGISQAVQVAADTGAYAALMGPAGQEVLREKPEAVQVALAGGQAVTFPVEFMANGTDALILRNLQLDISVLISRDAAPVLQYPRFSAAVDPTVAVAYIVIYRKQGLTQLENVSEQAAEQDGAGEAPPGANNLSKPISSEEAAAAAAAAAVRYKASTVPITDLPADLQRSPRDASSRGLPDAWYMLLKGDAEEGAIAELCDLITANNGTCGSHEAALQTDLLSITMVRSDLDNLLKTPEMAMPNKFGVWMVEKTYQTAGPAYVDMHPHHADPHQTVRHGELKRKVLHTRRGRHLLETLTRRSLAEDWFGAKLNTAGVVTDCYTATTAYTLNGKGRPFCPADNNGQRSYLYCGVPHCALSVYSTSEAPRGIEDWNWGLSRIGSDTGQDLDFTVDRGLLDGSGVHCFVLDTGVFVGHEEFSGRVEAQFDGFTGSDTQIDDDGHGSHVAGIMAGTETGVAPGCIIYAVKVLGKNGRSGTHPDGTSSIVKGIQWTVNKWKSVKATDPNAKIGVVNLSLGGPYSAGWESLVTRMTDAGLVVVAAAGNEDEDACTKSPAAVSDAITVAATNVDDTKGLYSNWGSCVDIFAPGTGIPLRRT